MALRMLCDENIVGIELLRDHIDLRTRPGREIRASDIADVDALWVRSVTRVDTELLRGGRLAFLGTATAGTDHVDLQAVAAAGVRFASAPGANANAVVEYVLSALARLESFWRALDEGACLGVVGFGEVGRRLAAVAERLGWSVRVCDPWVAHETPDETGFVSLDALVRECQVISLHCSLHRREPWPSYHLIDEQALGELCGDHLLINAARGAVIDQQALRARLRDEDAPQLVMDVWEWEPSLDDELLANPALRLATPHIAGYSWDSKWLASRMLLAAMVEAGFELPPPDTLAAPQPTALMPPVGATAREQAAGLLAQRYAIDLDDQRCRALRCLELSEQQAGFDRLRRDYPQRRELRGSRLDLTSCMTPLPALYEALGLVAST